MDFLLFEDTPLVPHDKHWQFSVGSCHAPMALRADYLEQLQFVHDELGIKRVRFHGLFNDDMHVGMSLKDFLPLRVFDKFSEFSFFQIGRVFDNILKTGVQPFVELGFMPKALASGKRNCTLNYKGNITMPKDLTKWGEFIGDFINFLIDRYGRDEVEQWNFEVWNEPNLPVFFAGTKEDYFKLYKVTAEAVKSVDEKIKVGGPSTANCAWINDFVNFCEDGGIPCDFISTHQYAGDPIGSVFRPTDFVKTMTKRLRQMKHSVGGTVLQGARMILADESEKFESRNHFTDNLAQIKPETHGLPLYYTEWNVSATCSAPINDTRRAAAYAIRTVLAVEGEVAGTSWWTFSDLFEEIQFFPDPFSGAFGMINNYGIPKPSFYAFKLLSMLGAKRYDLPKNPDASVEFAAFKKGNVTQILAYRQNFSPDAGRAEDCAIEMECAKPSAAFIYRIDEEHCNPQKVWQSLGSPKYPNPVEVEFIKSRSTLRKEPIEFEYAAGRMVIHTALFNNDVQLIEVVK